LRCRCRVRFSTSNTLWLIWNTLILGGKTHILLARLCRSILLSNNPKSQNINYLLHWSISKTVHNVFRSCQLFTYISTSWILQSCLVVESLATSSVSKHQVLVCSRRGWTICQIISFRIRLSIWSPCSNFRSGTWSCGWLLHVIWIKYYSLLISWNWSAALTTERPNLICWDRLILYLQIVLSTYRLLLIIWADSTSTTRYFLIWSTCFGRYLKLLMVFYISICSNFVRSYAYIVCEVGKVLWHWNEWYLRWYFLSWFSFFRFKWRGWYCCMCWWLRILSHLSCNDLVHRVGFSLVSWRSWVTRCMVRVKIIRR
jgi:hypothetical protein